MTIALIAGTGGLPPLLAESLLVQGRVPIICEMRGFPSDVKGEFTRIPFRIETLGTFLGALTSLDVTEVCMAGAVQRPDIDQSAIDAATAPMVPRLSAAMAKGDDGTLREVIAIFEDAGFTVIGAHQIAPELLPMAGVHTQVSPPEMGETLRVAKAALADMGRADQGQAMLLRGETVIAVEDARGTAAMLQDCCAPLDTVSKHSNSLQGKGAVLFKAPKPDQNLQADMPLIGPDTAMQAAEAGLAGIIIPAGIVMVLDLPQVVAILNAQGMFLWVTP